MAWLILAILKELFHFVLLLLLRTTVFLFVRKGVLPCGHLLVIAPHPDDEILGAGGAILSALQQKKTVHLLFLTDGEGTGVVNDPKKIRVERAKLSAMVMQRLGIPDENQHRFHLVDGRVPHQHDAAFGNVVTRIKELIDVIKPDNVMATHRLDYWPYDHVACADLAMAALALSNHKPALYFYWVWAWYNLRPWALWFSRPAGLFVVNISPWVKAKRELVDVYLNSKTPTGQPWSGVLPVALRLASRFHIEVLEKRIVK